MKSASGSLENDTAATDLQSVLGHSSLATTQVYAKMVDQRMRASIRALDYGLELAPTEEMEPRLTAAR